MSKINIKISLLNFLNLKIIVVTLAVISSYSFPQGWQWKNPLPQGNPISSLMYLNKDTVWASVSGGGSLLKSTDGGNTWKIFVLPERIYAQDVFFINEDVGWVCGQNWKGYPNYLLGTTDGGKNWKIQLIDTSLNMLTMVFANEKLGWVSGENSKIYHTTNGGETWYLQAHFLGDIHSIFLVDSLRLWAANIGAAGGAIFHTTDGGKNWLADSTVSWGYDIQFVDSLNGWVSGQDKIAHTTDGGKSWNTQFDSNGNKWEDIFMVGKNRGWAITSSETKIAVTTNGGINWNIKNDLGAYSLRAIAFYDSLNGLAAGWGGVIVKTSNGGTNWELITKSVTTANADLSDIFFIDDSTGWVCGSDGTRLGGYNGIILKTTNGGNSWTKLIINNTGQLNSIYFIDHLNGFAAGRGGTILKTTDGGTSWLYSNNGTINWNDIDFSNYPTGWIIGGDPVNTDRLIKTTDGGKTWNDVTSISFTTGTPEIHFTSKETGWLLIGGLFTNVQQLYKTTDKGDTWNLIRWNYSDTAYYSWQFISDKIGWISTFSYPTSILHTTDGGDSWEKYPLSESFGSISFIDPLTGWGASLQTIYSTNDGGKTWASQRAFSTDIQKVKFISNKYGFAIGLGGDILNTMTGGVTSIAEVKEVKVPNNFFLYQNYPNPFNSSTIISYYLPRSGEPVTIRIFDILGRLVKEIKTMSLKGNNTVTWNGTTNAGTVVSSGVYIYSIIYRGESLQKKLIYLK